MNHNHFVDAPGDLQLYYHVVLADDGEYLIEAANTSDATLKAFNLCSLLSLRTPKRSEIKAIQRELKHG